MSRRILCKVLLVVVAVFGLLVLSGVLFAQGRSEWAFERVKEVQELHTERLMALKGVEGTAIGLDENGQPVMLVLLETGNISGIPKKLDGVLVKRMVTGRIYALPKPPSPPGQDKKNKPPAPPTGLTVTGVSSSQINLVWNPNTEDDLGHYNVYRSGTSGGPYTQIGSAPKTDPTYSDAGLAAGTIYYYVVTAVDTAGKESDNSNQTSATTDDGPPDETPPADPTGLTATAVSSSQINLDWADNSESDLSHYNVYRSTTSGSYGEPIASNVTTSSYSDTGLAAETTYYYVVTAVDTSANESDNSPEDSATTLAESVDPTARFDRPVPIGVSTGHPDITAGTIGCRVTDGTNVYALSNNHVYADENNGIKGVDPVLQPGPYDGGTLDDEIGILDDFEPIVFHPLANNKIDAAIALCIGTLDNSTPEGGYGTPSAATRELTLADVDVLSVQKYGRTTGLTKGTVTGINATVRVRYSSGRARFVEQIVIESIAPDDSDTFSAGGDSGSLVVTQSGNNPVGLLFAGSSTVTIANPIDIVLERFDVDVDSQ